MLNNYLRHLNEMIFLSNIKVSASSLSFYRPIDTEDLQIFEYIENRISLPFNLEKNIIEKPQNSIIFAFIWHSCHDLLMYLQPVKKGGRVCFL